MAGDEGWWSGEQVVPQTLLALKSVVSTALETCLACFWFLPQQVLTTLFNLSVLYLHGNSIQRLGEVNKLAILPRLRSLTLHGNPVEEEKGYR